MENEWKASVLTPVHNTPISLLERAYESLKKQSFGFSRIQWVVVLHNCDPEYCRKVRILLGDSPNIHLFEANREGSTVSFARNVTLEHAAGEYLFFLDSDDEMAPDCVEQVVREMVRGNADEAIFTAAIHGNATYSDSCFVDADPAKGAQTFDAGDIRISRGMCNAGMPLWSRCYRRDILLKEGLSFDESLSFGEDVWFNIQATASARRVCLLPHFCGYIYYAGSGMALQMFIRAMSSSERGILQDCEKWKQLLRFDVILEEAQNHGLELDNIVWQYLFWLSKMILLMDLPQSIKVIFAEIIRPLAERLKEPQMEWKEKQGEFEEYAAFVRAFLRQGGLVSVIVPVYNAEDRLEQCVKSIASQSFRDIEILLIDDGSTDKSLSLCRKLEREDQRIRVFHQENAGEGGARNMGLRAANGKYILFVDDDDTLPSGALEALVKSMEEKEADLAVGDYVRIREETRIDKGFLEEYDLLSGQEYLYAQANSSKPFDYYFLCVWNKLFSAELIRNNSLSFHPKAILNDYAFLLDYLRVAKTIAIVHAPVYEYWFNSSSKLLSFKQEDSAEQWQVFSRSLSYYDRTIKELLSTEQYLACKKLMNREISGEGLSVIPCGGYVERNHALDRVRGKYILFAETVSPSASSVPKEVLSAAERSVAGLVVWEPGRESGLPQEISPELFIQFVKRKEQSENREISFANMLFLRSILQFRECYFLSDDKGEKLRFLLDYLRYVKKVLIF